MKVEYKVNELIDEKWIKNCTNLIWNRDMYSSNINKFLNDIRNGTFEEHSIITVYWLSGKQKYKIIGGQHRLQAIRLSKTSQLCDLKVITEATEKELMREYDIGNDVKNVRIIDDIKLFAYGYKNKYLISLLDEGKFPITITLGGGVNSMRIDNLLNVLHNGTRPVIGRQALGRKRIRGFIESLNQEKIDVIIDFFKLYKECFGDPDMKNWVYKTTFISTLMKIWLANKDHFDEEEIIQQFRKVSECSIIRQFSAGNDLNTIEQMVKGIYRVMNKNRSTNKFIEFWTDEIKVVK